MDTTKKDELYRRFKILYMLVVNLDIWQLENRVIDVGEMIDAENNLAEAMLLFYEKNIIAIMEGGGMVPKELIENFNINLN